MHRESVHFAVTHRALGTSIVRGNSTIAFAMAMCSPSATVYLGNTRPALGLMAEGACP